MYAIAYLSFFKVFEELQKDFLKAHFVKQLETR